MCSPLHPHCCPAAGSAAGSASVSWGCPNTTPNAYRQQLWGHKSKRTVSALLPSKALARPLPASCCALGPQAPHPISAPSIITWPPQGHQPHWIRGPPYCRGTSSQLVPPVRSHPEVPGTRVSTGLFGATTQTWACNGLIATGPAPHRAPYGHPITDVEAAGKLGD